MRVLVLSDIHANIDALEAVEVDAALKQGHVDETWVLGDLVDYGAAPAEVIAWVRAHATLVVRGNHDHAMGTGEDCRSSPLYHDLAVATRECLRPRLDARDRTYLGSLPLHAMVTLPRDRPAMLVHASPRDPLFGYVSTGASDAIWRAALGPACSVSYVFVGHTHDQFTRTIDLTTVVNPGSVGLPKDGDPRAAYAIFDNDHVELRRAEYDTERAAARIAALPLDRNARERLAHVIRYASLP